ncbi:fluoride efflux transporter FluC [uncultured Jatrophihabitans sp.]|uniref:fluoride efflux transporter FluC n=1 Tax=uncultured Jatrophihabitans sp. TaxID=1610747 RepID=UPI0035CC56D3
MIDLWVALAGGAGALARFVVDGAVRSRWPSGFPWSTVLINVSGSFALGVLTGLVIFRNDPNTLRLVLGTGLCGGYTTFGTASVETVRLAQRGAVVVAAGYALGSLVLAAGAAAAGLLVTR